MTEENTPATEPLDVRVQSRARHAPAHRIVAPPDDSDPRPVYTIACPPYLISGGVAITRSEAARLGAFLCRACFPPQETR